jgi:hypothetical protein
VRFGLASFRVCVLCSCAREQQLAPYAVSVVHSLSKRTVEVRLLAVNKGLTVDEILCQPQNRRVRATAARDAARARKRKRTRGSIGAWRANPHAARSRIRAPWLCSETNTARDPRRGAPLAAHRSRAALASRRAAQTDFVLCCGDDHSDEYMFSAALARARAPLPPLNSTPGAPVGAPVRRTFNITVGRKPSRASLYVEDTRQVLFLLQALTHHGSLGVI